MVAMGSNKRSVDRGHRLVRAQQLRQHRHASRRRRTSRGSGPPRGDRKTPWTVAELEASLPRPLVPDASWKVTASHDARPAPQANAEGGYNFIGNAAGALSFLGWTTGVPQQPGMWFQIELPAPRDADRDPVHVVDDRRACAARPPAWTFPRGYQVQVSADGIDLERAGRRRRGRARARRDHVRAGQREVRAHHADCDRDDAPPWSMRLVRFYEAPQ